MLLSLHCAGGGFIDPQRPMKFKIQPNSERTVVWRSAVLPEVVELLP